MAKVQPDQYSQAPIYLKLRFDETDLATATAFVYSRSDKLYLISNWHNYSGRNTDDEKPIHKLGGVPNTVSAYLCKNKEYIEREWFDFCLTSENKAYWLEHPIHKQNVDIGILPIVIPDDYRVFPINEMNNTEMRLRVSDDVFVLGYPLGLLDGHGMPIWKRASVASEPGLSSPSFHVDTATRQGMSGSPVIQRYRGFYKHDPKSQTVSPNDWFGEADAFIGVYSGRLGASQLEAQLGIVWKKNLIEEVIDGGTVYER